MIEDEDSPVQDQIAHQEIQDVYDPHTDDDWDDLTEQTKAKVISKLIKSDYNTIVEDTQKLFAQEMKTGNLDIHDLKHCNKVFQLISLIRGFQERRNLQKDVSTGHFIKQLLIEVYAKIGLSNSKGGMFIDLLFKNISERTYAYDNKKSSFSMGKLLRRG